MNIALQQLKATNLHPIYIISGEEQLLIAEAKASIIKKAIAAGFSEQISLQADKTFNWANFLTDMYSPSLFESKVFLTMHLTGKPGTAGSKALQQYAANPNPDKILLLLLPKLDSSSKNSKWYKALDKVGLSVQVWPIATAKLPNWLQERMRRYELTTSDEGLRILAAFTEGNLLAAAQAIEKLHLLYGKGQLTAKQILAASSNSSHFTLFNLVDNILLGNTQKALRILYDLKNQKIEPILILWAISKELRVLYKMQLQHITGSSISSILRQHRVWSSRQQIVTAALKNYSAPTLLTMLQHCAKIDRCIKGIENGEAWHELEALCSKKSY